MMSTSTPTSFSDESHRPGFRPTFSTWAAMSNAFPSHPSYPAATFGAEVQQRVERLNVLRNRVAHYEPIHRRNVRSDVIGLSDVTGWICRDSEAWMLRQAESMPSSVCGPERQSCWRPWLHTMRTFYPPLSALGSASPADTRRSGARVTDGPGGEPDRTSSKPTCRRVGRIVAALGELAALGEPLERCGSRTQKRGRPKQRVI